MIRTELCRRRFKNGERHMRRSKNSLDFRPVKSAKRSIYN